MALKKENIIRKKSELDTIFKKGKTRKGDFLSIKEIKNNLNHARFAIIIPTRVVKKSTQRNKIKRLISEFIRLNYNLENNSRDILVILNKKSEKNYYSGDLDKLL